MMSQAADILLVDDTANNLHLLIPVLSEHGYKVRVAPNGARALRAVSKKKPDLILLDILMPEMSGFEVCQQLKMNKETADIPVVFISALQDDAEKTAAFSEGGAGYITKPVNEMEILTCIKTQLALRHIN